MRERDCARLNTRVLLRSICGSIFALHVLAVQATGPSATLHIRTGAEGLSIDAHGVPLAQVLRAIGREIGADVYLYGELNRSVDDTITDLTIKEAVQRLVGDAALAMTYTPERTTGATADVTEIRVYARGGGSEMIISKPPSVSQASGAALSSDPGDAGEATAVDLLEGLDLAARIQLVDELAVRGDELAIRTLASVLAQAEEDQLRYRALDGLARLGEPAVDALTNGLADPKTDLRQRTVAYLGAIGGERATLSLGQVLFGERDPHLRRRAVQQLAREGSEAALAFLEAAAEKDPDEDVRAAAHHALGVR